VELSEARKVFDKLDTDQSGELEGAEVKELMRWYCEQVLVDGEPLTPPEVEAESSKFLLEIDANGDGVVTLEEFEIFFKDKANRIEEASKRLIMHRIEAASGAELAMQSTPDIDKLEEALSEVQKKWKELDTDQSGELVAEELDQLIAFVLEKVAQPGASPEDMEADSAMAKQFAKDVMTYPEFEALFTTLMKRQSEYGLMMAEQAADFDSEEARGHFQKLDTDKTGYLEGEEIDRMAEWVFGEFSPGGVALRPEQIACEAKKMMKEIDKKSPCPHCGALVGDGKVSFEEFEEYFKSHASQLEELRRQSSLAKMIKEENNCTQDDCVSMSQALLKFKELDKDNSNTLNAEETELLAHWVYTSFRPDGKRLDNAQIKIESGKLINKLDTERTGIITFEAFEGYFNTKHAQSLKFQNAMLKKGNTTYRNSFTEEPIAPVCSYSAVSLAPVSAAEVKDTVVPNMSFAYRKFKQLDKDNSDKLDRDEVLALAKWVYTSFRKDGALLDGAQVTIEAQKLCNKLDVDKDGQVTFDEFVAYFEKKVEQAKKFHGVLDKKGTGQGKRNVMCEDEYVDLGDAADAITPPQNMPKLSNAYKKFQELDADKSGLLNKVELRELANWVYTSFNAEGKRLEASQVDIEAGKLLNKLDADQDGGVTFEEFCGYYETKLKQAEKFAAAVAKRNKK